MAYLRVRLTPVEWEPGERPKAVDVVTVDGEMVSYVSERTCRMGAPIDGEYRCGECGHLNRETYRADKGWYPPEYCAHCGARVVEGDA